MHVGKHPLKKKNRVSKSTENKTRVPKLRNPSLSVHCVNVPVKKCVEVRGLSSWSRFSPCTMWEPGDYTQVGGKRFPYLQNHLPGPSTKFIKCFVITHVFEGLAHGIGVGAESNFWGHFSPSTLCIQDQTLWSGLVTGTFTH